MLRVEDALHLVELADQARVAFGGLAALDAQHHVRGAAPAHERAAGVDLHALARGAGRALPVAAGGRGAGAGQRVVGGAEEQIEPGVSGLLIPPGDAAAMMEALQNLVPDAARRAALGASARKRVEDRFSLQEETAAWLRLFERVTAK